MEHKPSFQFYPGDWRKDPGVQSLTFRDRGVWFELLCLMHESEQRGKLLLNGKSVPEDALARLLGLDRQTLADTVERLLDYGVASVCPETGALMNRRMVRDGQKALLCGDAGRKGGGNPNLKGQAKGDSKGQSKGEAKGEAKGAPKRNAKASSSPSGGGEENHLGTDLQSCTESEHGPPDGGLGALPAGGNGSNGGRFYLTRKGRRLSGWKLETFEEFFQAFAYRDGKAKAADAWMDSPGLTPEIARTKIVPKAKLEASRRHQLRAQGLTPKMAQGWISERRWEDEGEVTTTSPTTNDSPKIEDLRSAAKACFDADGKDCDRTWEAWRSQTKFDCHYCPKFDAERGGA